MNVSHYYNYLLVMTDGSTKGFNDLETAKGYINIYYEDRIKKSSLKRDYHDITELPGQFRNNICQHMGVGEGECRVYDLDDFIEKLREQLVFDDEKEEIISKLLQKDISLNIYDYSLDNILTDVKVINMIEPYGEVWFYIKPNKYKNLKG